MEIKGTKINCVGNWRTSWLTVCQTSWIPVDRKNYWRNSTEKATKSNLGTVKKILSILVTIKKRKNQITVTENRNIILRNIIRTKKHKQKTKKDKQKQKNVNRKKIGEKHELMSKYVCWEKSEKIETRPVETNFKKGEEWVKIGTKTTWVYVKEWIEWWRKPRLRSRK